MTPPGGKRETEWTVLPDGAACRVTLYRGYDCRVRCEHEPPILPNDGGHNHGQHADEWILEYRSGDWGGVLQCYSWIKDGAIDRDWDIRRRAEARSPRKLIGTFAEYRQLSIYGARVSVHHKEPSGEECPIFGTCRIAFCGYLFSSEFFERAHCEALEPLALRPVDEIDLGAVIDVMAPVWQKLAKLLEESANVLETP